MRTTIKSNIFIINLMFLINFFLPTWNSILSRTGTHGFIILNILLVALLSFQFAFSFRLAIPKLNLLIKLFTILFCILFFQILLSSFLYQGSAFSDAFELIRPILYFLILYSGYSSVKKGIVDLDWIIKVISNYTLAVVIFGIFCLVFKAGIGGSIISLYAKDSLVSSSRFVGTFMNPYDFAILFSISFSYFFTSYLKSGQFSFLLKIFVLLVALAISQSKNVFATFVYAGILIPLMYNFFIDKEFRSKKIKSNVRVFLILLFISILSFYIYINYKVEIQYLVNGISNYLRGTGDRSTDIRVEQLSRLIHSLSSSPAHLLLGFGSRKADGLMFESLYTLYLFRYGLLGIVLIFSYSIIPSYFAAFEYKRYGITPTSALIIMIFFSSVLVSGVGNNVIDQARISFPFFFLLGAFLSKINMKSRTDSICDED